MCADIKFKKVLITGQGRGGTSAIASIFYHLGYFMPSAHKLSTLEDTRLRKFLACNDIESITKELSNRAKKYNLIAWKDPKLFGKNGKMLAASISNDWLYLIVFRDPYAIAARNNQSMGIDFDTALLNASKYNMKLIEFYFSIKDKNPCYLISYEKLLTSKLEAITSICDFLGFEDSCEMAKIIAGKMEEDHGRYLASSQKG